jgi:2-oxoglutarate dehydrogenase E2 component (dihydrolipoamide succinyltransferase)
MEKELKVPEIGESITEVIISEWLKAVGDSVDEDEPIVIIESDKVTLELPAPTSGVLLEQGKGAGDSARVGEVIGKIGVSEGQAAASDESPSKKSPSKEGPPKATYSKGTASRVTEPSVTEPPPAPPIPSRQEKPPAPTPRASVRAPMTGGRQEEIVPLSPIRRRIAQRLVAAQQDAALLTTFNEVDMSEVIALRREVQERFKEKHGVKLGFMSFFVKASIEALKDFPGLNAEIRGNDVVYRNYFDIGIAVGGGKGLVVPIIRNAERLGFAEVELEIRNLAARAQANQLELEELTGGTFTITNGGVYGSLLSTPIVNPPQSGVLGLHAIQDRPVARNGEVVIRPMMYVALTYDHRLVDGREAVTFLGRIKELLEDPARFLLEA